MEIIYTVRHQGRPCPQANCTKWENVLTGEHGHWDENGEPVVEKNAEGEADH